MKDIERRTNPKTTDRTGGTGRRTFLKVGAMAGATAVGGAVVTGTASTRTEPRADLTVQDGESAEVGDGTVKTAAVTNSSGELVSLDVHVDDDALASVDDDGKKPHESVAAHLSLPSDVDTHQFTFVGLHYNPVGHAPPGVYTVPHFDFHFYTVEESTVESIPFGLAAYDVPDEQFPPGYRLEDPRLIVPEMGEHLLDGTAPEFGDGEFTHTYVYGTYDPAIDPEDPKRVEEMELEDEKREVPVFEGDGESRLHFVEPMVTNEYLADLEQETSVDVETPEVFPVEDRYPTEYVLKPDDSGVSVSIGGFEEFPGPSG
ncbi:hypothetical protein [Halorussus salinisoli]|uniref:hypothetical protein n=1 Tax=Halorussus salinisoli TaxID=2558242 RepID=UPI0010C1B652|nr:hypothetical protein [Halorussus salinisoli]